MSTLRDQWTRLAERIALPVLDHAALGLLPQAMPNESPAHHKINRAPIAPFEALARTLVGLAPWLEQGNLAPALDPVAARLAGLATRSLEHLPALLPPADIDWAMRQTLVECAHLSLAILRAPVVLWEKLSPAARASVHEILTASRAQKPPSNNWILFSALVETALAKTGAAADIGPVDFALSQFADWYAGDGHYGDGPRYHANYYNSLIMHPALVAVLAHHPLAKERWDKYRDDIVSRARRYATVQERTILPDGSFPPTGRSLSYRCGAFHHLADSALRHDLPSRVPPARVRAALDAVIRRTLGAPQTFDANDWLRIGLCGHQPSLAENYISTGSLYLCTAAFLPLGLPAKDPFWSDPDEPSLTTRLFSGEDLPVDHTLRD